MVAWLLIARSRPASAGAASRAIGTPEIENGDVAALWNASTAAGATSPKACCQASVARGTSTMLLASGIRPVRTV